MQLFFLYKRLTDRLFVRAYVPLMVCLDRPPIDTILYEPHRPQGEYISGRRIFSLLFAHFRVPTAATFPPRASVSSLISCINLLSHWKTDMAPYKTHVGVVTIRRMRKPSDSYRIPRYIQKNNARQLISLTSCSICFIQ